MKRKTFIKSLFLPRQGLTELFLERPVSPEPVRLCKLIKFNASLGFVVSVQTFDYPENGTHHSGHCTAGK